MTSILKQGFVQQMKNLIFVFQLLHWFELVQKAVLKKRKSRNGALKKENESV